jgi:hypothetical protein
MSYSMLTGRCHRDLATASLTIDAHRELLLAGATAIVIRDQHQAVVTLASLSTELFRAKPRT